MVRALRGSRARSAIAAVTLSAMLTLTLSMASHDGSDDPLCADWSLVHGAGPTHLTGNQVSPPPADHCVLCHAAQTVRAALVASQPVPPAQALCHAGSGLVSLAASVSRTGRPARAPPRA